MTLLGSACTDPGVPPVPLSGTLAEAVSDEDAMVSVPGYGPLREGEKMTPVKQLSPAARLEPQAFPTR